MNRTGLYVICLSTLAVSLATLWLQFSGILYLARGLERLAAILTTVERLQ